MDKVYKASNSECCTRSEHFRIYFTYKLSLRYRKFAFYKATHRHIAQDNILDGYTGCFKKMLTVVFQTLLCGYSSKCWTMDSLYTFHCKSFRNTRHTVTFGIPQSSFFLNSLPYQWKPHWTVTILHKTGVLLFIMTIWNPVHVLWINLWELFKFKAVFEISFVFNSGI
jgi:hypothetical protein